MSNFSISASNYCAPAALPPADADLVAELLVKAELRGYAGHGVTRVGQYLEFIKNKTYDLSAKPEIEREGKVTAVIDGQALHRPGRGAHGDGACDQKSQRARRRHRLSKSRRPYRTARRLHGNGDGRRD